MEEGELMGKGIQFKNKGGEKIYPCPFYPIGSVYISFNNTDPSTYFGGSWERIKGKFLLSADDNTYRNETTGGEASHKLTTNEMPSHSHGLSKTVPYGVPYNDTGGSLSGNSGSGPYYRETYNPPWTVNNAGGGQAHNNMPPYIAVYMWRRTA
jgi:hypothetical protein